MPKELFFALAPEKQEKIFKAALCEFSLHEYHSASINQIVKTAQIARGSFYLYFEDKQDLYLYLVDRIFRYRLKIFCAQQGQPFSDLFAFHYALFRFNLTLLSDATYESLFKNLYLSMEYRFSCEIRGVIAQIRHEMIAQLPLADASPEAVALAEEQLEILQLITHNLLASKILEARSDQDILQEYRRKAQLLSCARFSPS